MFSFSIFIIFLIVGLQGLFAGEIYGCVQILNDTYEVTDSTTHCIAYGTFNNRINETGWSFLNITTNDTLYDDYTQSYSAGFLEGYFTKDLIYPHWINGMNDYPEDYAKVREFINANKAYMLGQFDANSKDEFWYQASLIYNQSLGLIDGYQNYCEVDTYLSVDNLTYMLYYADISDLKNANSSKVWQSDSCTAFVKVTEDRQNIIVGHNTWFKYHFMLRVYKVYNFPFKTSKTANTTVPGHTISMSSYPVYLFSKDDFYVTSSKLVVQETTIGNNNKNLTKFISYKSVPIWIRTMVSNRLASGGEEWCGLYSRENNGCYLNQFMITDMKLFTPGNETLDEDLLWVVEQIPNMTIYRSQTHVLQEMGYWGSYNNPAFPEIREYGNFTAQEVDGDYYKYNSTPRALIFKRDQGTVHNLETMRKLMRYNKYKDDKYSKCNCTPPYSASLTLAMRGDLNLADGVYPISGWGQRNHGALDAKITDYYLMEDMSVQIISGPTYDDVPPFQWSTSPFHNTSHIAHPDFYKFSWYEFNSINGEVREIVPEDESRNLVIKISVSILFGVFVLIIIFLLFTKKTQPGEHDTSKYQQME